MLIVKNFIAFAHFSISAKKKKKKERKRKEKQINLLRLLQMDLVCFCRWL